MWYYRIGFPPCLKVNWKQQIKTQISIIIMPHIRYEKSPTNPSSLYCILLISPTLFPLLFGGEYWWFSAAESHFQPNHLSLAVWREIKSPDNLYINTQDLFRQLWSLSECPMDVFSASRPTWLQKIGNIFFFRPRTLPGDEGRTSVII